MRSLEPRCGGAGAAALSRGFAVVCGVTAELPRVTSPRRDLSGLAPSTDVSRWEAAGAGGSGFGTGIVLARRVSVVEERRCLGGGGWFDPRGGVARAWALLGSGSLRRRGQRLQPRTHQRHLTVCRVTTSPLGMHTPQTSWIFMWPKPLSWRLLKLKIFASPLTPK